MSAPEAVAAVFAAAASRAYLGERVTVAEHQLRTAARARAAGAEPALVVAALLHDVGHVVEPAAGRALAGGVDARHEVTGAAWLAGWFGPEITEPVRLHVAAKRYLCAADPAYRDHLSRASRRTLRLQGGPFTPGEAAAFAALPHARAAVDLRRWDDGGKDPLVGVPPLSTYLDLLDSVPPPRP